MKKEIKAIRFIVSGRVQGVYFRWFTREAANRIGLKGYVRNLPDGRVEAWAEGNPAELDAFRSEVSRGPRMAHVTGIEEQECEPKGDFSDFDITY
jgi:acylphosphatase